MESRRDLVCWVLFPGEKVNGSSPCGDWFLDLATVLKSQLLLHLKGPFFQITRVLSPGPSVSQHCPVLGELTQIPARCRREALLDKILHCLKEYRELRHWSFIPLFFFFSQQLNYLTHPAEACLHFRTSTSVFWSFCSHTTSSSQTGEAASTIWMVFN